MPHNAGLAQGGLQCLLLFRPDCTESMGPSNMSIILFSGVDPVLFSIDVFGFELALRWYSLAYITGFLIAWRWIVAMCRNRILYDARPPIAPQQLEQLVTWSIVGVIAGGRLGYVFVYDFEHFLHNPIDILKLWKGGMSFHGGISGLALAVWSFARIQYIPVLALSDMIAIAACPGLFLGRMANFANGELWGRPSDVSWAIAVPDGPGSDCPADWIGICARHPSQIYEALLEGLVLGVVLAVLAYRYGWLRYPGRLTGFFLAGYGAARILVEFFRSPDPQFVDPGNPDGYALNLGNGLGLTMGQSLSIPMILLGSILIARFWRNRDRAR